MRIVESRPCLVGVVVACACAVVGCVRYHPQPLSAPQIETEYRTRTLTDRQLAAFVTSNGGTVPAPASAVDLRTAVAIGYYYSADLDVARAQVAAANAGVRLARARINPNLGVDVGYDTEPDFHRQYAITPSFTIETAGKRGARILQAEKQAESARVAFAESSWALRSRVRSAFVNHQLAVRRLDLLQRERDIRSEIVQIFDQRLAVGEAARPELDFYRVELISTEAALRTALGEVAQTRSDVASAIGMPLSAFDGVAFTTSSFDTPVADDQLPVWTVQRAGLVHRADVRRLLTDYAATDAALRLEVARQYPDIVLSPAYTFEEGFVRYVLGTVLEPVPLFHHNQAAIALAEAQRQEAGAKFEALQARAIGEMERAVVQYRAAYEGWRNATDQLVVVQQAREAAARRALEAGEGDRLSLATVRLQTATAERTRLDALTQVQTALGALEDAMQQPLQDALNAPEPPLVNPRKGTNAR